MPDSWHPVTLKLPPPLSCELCGVAGIEVALYRVRGTVPTRWRCDECREDPIVEPPKNGVAAAAIRRYEERRAAGYLRDPKITVTFDREEK